MLDKNKARLRRSKSTRARIASLGIHRLGVFRSNMNIYAQVFSPCGTKIVVSASTLDSSLKQSAGGNVSAAQAVGKLIAERALAAGITSVAFDRSGYKYHGRIKALADAAREGGLAF